MLWEDDSTAVFETGRKAIVPRGIIGINNSGTVAYAGSMELRAVAGSFKDTTLSPVERLEVARTQIRLWRGYESQAEKDSQPRGGDIATQDDGPAPDWDGPVDDEAGDKQAGVSGEEADIE